MNNTSRKIVIAVIIVIICGSLVAILKNDQTEPITNEFNEETRLVKADTIHLGSNPIEVKINGKLTAANKIDLYSEVNGVLLNTNFLEGAKFNQGQVLVSIDNAELKNAIKSQKSTLLNQTASLVSDLKFDFPENLATWEQFLAKINFNKSLPELPEVKNEKLKKYLAGKQLYATYFTIKSQEEKLKKHSINAPFNGVLTQTLLKKGTLVRAGQKLGEFIQPNLFELEVDVTLIAANKIQVGDKVNLMNEARNQKQGTVIRKNGTVNSESQNVKIYISLNGADLFEGVYMEGVIQLNKVPNSVYVNRSLMSGSNLFTIKNGKLVTTSVKVLAEINDKVLITGLEENDLILSESLKGTYNGMKVRY